MVIKVYQRTHTGTLAIDSPALVSAINDGDEEFVRAAIEKAGLLPVGADPDDWDWYVAPDPAPEPYSGDPVFENEVNTLSPTEEAIG